MNEIIVSSRVRLARNYADLPFRSRITPEQSQECIQRTLEVLRELPEPYTFLPLRGMEENEKKALLEKRLISPDLMDHQDMGAVLVGENEKVSVMINEEDHLRIQGFAAGENLREAADNAFFLDDALQKRLTFAFDDQWGYLTACPTNAGSGLRATLFKQMGKVNQLAARLGLTLRGIYGEGSEALGNLYQLSNLVTLGRTEKEIIDAVSATARQMVQMEQSIREKAIEKDPMIFEDQVFRGYGVLSNARRMPIKEFMVHWSNLRLGAAAGKLPVPVSVCDDMLIKAQPAHVQRAADGNADPKALDIVRGTLIRKMIADAAS